jgi:hypothetical protein
MTPGPVAGVGEPAYVDGGPGLPDPSGLASLIAMPGTASAA